MKLLLCLLLAAAARAQDHGSISGNPYTTREDAEAGGASFRSQCASCHGLDASGGVVGPSLVTGAFKHGATDEALFGTITRGVPGTAMTGFKLSGRETWQLVAFLRAMSIAKAAGAAPGDAAKGERLYEANGCGGCHTRATRGGFSGPDLSEIGSRRSLAELESALLDPDADVAPDYWSLRARTKAGETVTGIRMNEDMDSFQIRDPQGRLRSLRKSDLANFEILRASPMPAVKGKLNAGEVQDLVAYLATLRAQPAAEGQPK